MNAERKKNGIYSNRKLLKKTKEVSKTEQGYIISRTVRNGRTEFVECVFRDYTESRKAARKLIEKLNKEIFFYNLKSQEENNICLMKEISPDVWTCQEETISIEVIMVKEIMKKRKIKTQEVAETNLEFIKDEVLIHYK